MTNIIHDINEYFKLPQSISQRQRIQLFKSIVCADGFHISAQASDAHYCQPRNSEGPWEKIELGYPKTADEHIKEFAENPEEPTGTVYGYVPVALVNAMIVAHGGIDLEKTQERFDQINVNCN